MELAFTLQEPVQDWLETVDLHDFNKDKLEIYHLYKRDSDAYNAGLLAKLFPLHNIEI